MKLPVATESFEKAPAGNHLAVCYEVIDLGTQTTEYQSETRRVHQIWIGWELTNELMDDGRPYVIGRRYTLSSHEKSSLRKDLESWRGKPFSDDDFGRFEIGHVIRAACFLNVVHNTKDDRTYANIEAVAALPKGTAPPDLVNAPVLFDLTSEGYVPEIFAGLSQRMQETIAASPEYQELAGKPATQEKPAKPVDGTPF